MAAAGSSARATRSSSRSRRPSSSRKSPSPTPTNKKGGQKSSSLASTKKKTTTTSTKNKKKTTQEKHWGSGGDADKYGAFINATGIILLIATTPFLAVMIWDVFVNRNGSVSNLVSSISKKTFTGYLKDMLPWPSKEAIAHLLSYATFEALLQLYLPGKKHFGPVTANGNIPEYKANGVLSLITTYVGFFAAWHFGLTSPKIVYDLFGEMLFAMSVFAIFFCLFLTFKGLYFPTDSDSGTNGSFLYDFYWGTELYPKFGPLNVKQFTNCRFGMMAWALLPVVFACYQYERDGFLADSVLACVILMCTYNAKFFTGKPDTSILWISCTIELDITFAGVVWSGCLLCTCLRRCIYLPSNRRCISGRRDFAPSSPRACYPFGSITILIVSDKKRGEPKEICSCGAKNHE